MEILKYIDIDENSRKPKYLQLVDSIIKIISLENIPMDGKIPSINDVSEELYLARGTVEKAYKILKERNIIKSVKGKGYYISKTTLFAKTNILFLINKLSSSKLQLYNSFNNRIRENAHADLQIYHYDESLFLNLLDKNTNNYDYFVIVPHFKSDTFKSISSTEKVIKAIQNIPSKKLILLDNSIPGIHGNIIEIYQDFENDIYNALLQGFKKIATYNKVFLVSPNTTIYNFPKNVDGFRKFCVEKSLDYEIIDEIYDDIILKKRDLFITILEDDVVNLINQIRKNEFKIGKDIGILSYNDTPLKEHLEISVISTDFKKMGETAAEMILTKKKGKIKNPFNFIDRRSL